MENTKLKGKVVLVTGASGGIGRAIALKFAELQARVVVHYHQNKGRAEQTRQMLAGNGHITLQADLTDGDDVKPFVTEINSRMGGIDILINNAGIHELHPPTEVSYEVWQDVWQRTLAANLLGPANLSFCVIQTMLQNGGGRIINISSRGAFRGEPEGPAYGASKAGLNAMSQSLAKALAPHNIFVYAIAPGFVETEMVAPILNSPKGEEIRQQSPLGRVAKPEEVAHTAVFLAAEGSEFLTGCIVDVNGASYLR